MAHRSATGHPIHGMDNVIVPMTASEMSYFRNAGVKHDVQNETSSEICSWKWN